MRVLVLCGGADTGGQGIRIRTAFSLFRPDIQVTSVTAGRNYMNYDEDVFWSGKTEPLIADLYEQADVIHVRNTFDAHRRFEKKRGGRKRKPVVIQHHGSMFRTDHAYLMRQARQLGAVELVSTIDLLKFGKTLTWLPIPHDIEELARLRQNTERDADRIVIHHSPTHRRIKDTELFEAVGDQLMEKYPNVECRVVERMSWRDNLALKAEADIVYDQLQLGWGNNAIEAWAMGIPVVAGTEDPRARQIMVDTLGALPIEEAQRGTLYSVLEGLILDPEKRAAAGGRGLRYVRQWHDHEVVVPRLVEAYERAVS